ncbi:LytR/AlgR family response regulator transcription factor [Anaeroselena agilis]|uniref:LytTR family DNA-binding domain-containing protein n=1 Tax=Anaeroselena agilis TaxID=3063788 RepID=A0ABU3NS97_9FIRM|nr:LytTR family DNA-binding domain-containing protein [Selenomonadales bacterium 4137-cl]
MLKVMIVDDEAWALEELQDILGGHCTVAGAFDDPVEAVEGVARLEPDVVFLDIEMPEMNGFQAAGEILARRPQTGLVFATAYSQYAAKAFDLEAIDYLLKPFDPARVVQSLKRIEKRFALEGRYQSRGLSLAVHRELGGMKLSQVWLSDNGLLRMIPVASIDACFVRKADRHATVIASGAAYRSSYGLQEFMAQCDAKLIRCHRSCYVRPASVCSLKTGKDRTLWLRLCDWPEELPVSRQYRDDIFNELDMKKVRDRGST